MDRRNDKPEAGDPEAVANSINDQESAPMSSQYVEIEPCVNDARSGFQYVLIEHEASDVCSLSESSEWSFEYLEADLATHNDKGPAVPLDLASKSLSEAHATTANDGNLVETYGVYSSLDISPELSINGTSSNLSITSDASRLFPESTGGDASEAERKVLVGGGPAHPAQGDFITTRNRVPAKLPGRTLPFVPMDLPTNLSPEQSVQPGRPGRKTLGLKLFSKRLAQHMLAPSHPHDLQQQTHTLNLTNVIRSHGLRGDNVRTDSTTSSSKGAEVASARFKTLTALDQRRQDVKCKQDRKGKQKQVLVATSGTTNYQSPKPGKTVKHTLDSLEVEALSSRQCFAQVEMEVWRLRLNSRPTVKNGEGTVCESNKDEDDLPNRTKPETESPKALDKDAPIILMTPMSSLQTKARRLTRRCQISPAPIYDQAASTTWMPEEHFEVQNMRGSMSHAPRYVNCWNDREIMLVADGSCTFMSALDGQDLPGGCEPSAGASFIYRPTSNDSTVSSPTCMPFQATNQAHRVNKSARDGSQRRLPMSIPAGKIALRLETQGPRGDVQKHTSNRAKLRAVIAALDFRPWHAEGWKRVVVVTDLEYVALGATKWISLWAKRKWRSAPSWTKEGKMRLGKKIANRDLWEELQSRIDILREYGTEVSFWLVPSTIDSPLLREAKAAAREAARVKFDTVIVEEYTKLTGIGM